MHRRIGVESLDALEQACLAHGRVELDQLTGDPNLGRDPGLGPDIGTARRMVAHDDHRKTGGDAVVCSEALGPPLQQLPQPFGRSLAIDDLSHGRRFPSKQSTLDA